MSSVVLYSEAHGTTFVRDEWNLILTRSGVSLDAFLRPHNLHLIAFQVLVYKALLATVGLSSYAPYRAVSVLLDAVVTVLVFLFARRRVGPGGALAAAALIAFPGRGADDVIWPFQMGFLLSTASGIGMLLALERRRAPWDIAACVLLVIALGSSGVGLAFAAIALIQVVTGLERRARCMRVLAVPLGLYGVWWATHGGPVPRNLAPQTEPPHAPKVDLWQNFLHVPRYVADAAGAGLASTAGLDLGFGAALALLVLVLLVVRVRVRPPDPRFWIALALPLSYWGLLALARSQLVDFTAPRYIYPAVAFIVLAAVEVMRGIRLPPRAKPWLAGVIVVAILSNIGALNHQARGYRALARQVLPRLTAIELARDHVYTYFRPFPSPFGAAPDVFGGPYLAAVAVHGSPAPSVSKLIAGPETQRESADATLIQALTVMPKVGRFSLPAGHAPRVVMTYGGTATVRGRCAVLTPSIAQARFEMRVPTSGMVIQPTAGAAVTVRARQIASAFGAPFAALVPGRPSMLDFPPDRVARPWYVRLDSSQIVRACARRA